MRQKKNGQKIQNWHRPLAPQQPGRWFLRHRHDAPPDAGDTDYCLPETWHEEADPQDLRCQELKQFLREVLQCPEPLFRLEWPMGAVLQGHEVPTSTARDAGAGNLEARLAAFVGSIDHFPNNPAMCHRIADALGDDVCKEVIASARKHENGYVLVRHVSLFAPFWIRSPRTWSGGKASLVDHLFVRYSVPTFLYTEWSRETHLTDLKWLCWFILFAQGGSLRRAAEPFHWNIPARLEHFLRESPAGASPTEACVLAQIKRLGGTAIDSRRILRNRALLVDSTNAAGGPWDFWETTVRWVIAHGATLSDEQCELILSWAVHEHTEAIRRNGASFSLKGRGVRAVLELSLAYQRRLEQPWACYSWPRHGWDWTPTDPTLEGWQFVELTSGEELFREGRAMRHCVSTYASRCAAGHSAIVSVRYHEARLITVEIAPATGEVVQARGSCNRGATREEWRAIRCWVEAVVSKEKC